MKCSPRRLGVLALLAFMVVPVVSANGQTVDSPLPIQFFVPVGVALDQDETNYFMMSLPAGSFKVVVDTRQPDGRNSNIQSALSITDADGALVKERVIDLNEIDTAWRQTYSFSLTRPLKTGFKLTNFHERAYFSLVVLRLPDQKGAIKRAGHEITEGDLQEADLVKYSAALVDLIPFPFFGTVMPKLLLAGQTQRGRLDEGDSAYYITVLPKGKHHVVVGFDNADHQKTNIQGYLAFLDGDGGGQQSGISFNEIDVSARKATDVTMRNASVVVIRVKNDHLTVNYSVMIRPTE